MYEVFPVLAGIVMALVAPRLVDGRARLAAYGVVGAIVAVLATIVAGEEWFFVFVDLAEVVLSIGVTLAVATRVPFGKATKRTTVEA